MSNHYGHDLDEFNDDYNERDAKREKHQKKHRKMDVRRLIEERKEKKRWQCDLESYEY